MDNNEMNQNVQTTETKPRFSMPPLLKVQSSPHIKSPETTATVMLDVLIALIPAFIWGVYVFGTRALVIGVISVAAAVGFEALTQFLLHRSVTVSDLSAAVTGLLLAMNLPVAVPLWMPVVGAFFAIVVVKQLFGGIGKNFVNPALAARVFLFSWAGDMSTFQKFGEKINSAAVTLTEGDIVAGATPLASLKQGVIPDANIFDMLTGNMGGCIGEVSSILLIAGGVFLLVRRVITWQIPVAYIGTVALVTFLLPKGGGIAADFMLYELLSGGTYARRDIHGNRLLNLSRDPERKTSLRMRMRTYHGADTLLRKLSRGSFVRYTHYEPARLVHRQAHNAAQIRR